MKVLTLSCSSGHGFEGWFGSEEDFQSQLARGLVCCPLCNDSAIARLPSAPRLNLSGARDPERAGSGHRGGAAGAAGAQQAGPVTQEAHWMRAVRQVLMNTEDVGDRFPEEARRIHYGEAPDRGIRGQASAQDRAALADEGIEVVALPLPDGMKGQEH